MTSVDGVEVNGDSDEDRSHQADEPESEPHKSPISNNNKGKRPTLAENEDVTGSSPDSTATGSSISDSRSPKASLAERRARNMKRNADLLVKLGLQHGILPNVPTKKRARTREPETQTLPDESKPSGMLLQTRSQKNTSSGLSLDTIYERYPQREPQIRRLLGCILPTASFQDYVPAPIVCHGPSGAGKTAIVLDVLDLLTAHRTAYINCRTFEQMSSAENIVRQIARQLLSTRSIFEQAASNKEYSGEDDQALPLDAPKKKADTAAKGDVQAMHATIESDSALCAVWDLGRELKDHHYSEQSSVIVFDHAEQLLSMVHSNKNMLSQLMLLPQVFQLNLTIVVVSNSMLLSETGINNLVPAQLSLGTISGNVQPINIHFPSYRRKRDLKVVLLQPHIRELITGRQVQDTSDHKFSSNVYRSFLDTLLNSLHTTTNDVKEIVQLARVVWPKFVLPLNKDNIGDTLKTARQAAQSKAKGSEAVDPKIVEREIFAFLDRKVLNVMRELTSGYGTDHSGGGEPHGQSILMNYLLIAVFLCQVNHPEKDQYLFSIRKNGRRRRQDADRDEQEDVAFGSDGDKSHSKLIRPRTFPLERVLSVFVGIVGLSLHQKSGEEPTGLLGDVSFNEMLASLRDRGWISAHPSQSASDSARLSEPRYYTSITEEEAVRLAGEVQFPLDKFINR